MVIEVFSEILAVATQRREGLIFQALEVDELSLVDIQCVITL